MQSTTKTRHILTPQASESYKIGVDEVQGLKGQIVKALFPIQDQLLESIYWNDCKPEPVEYKSRDGFIANSHNAGGLQIQVIIPKCESYEFGFIEFGECDGCADNGADCTGDDSKYPDHGGECGYESEGHLDASLTIFLKFEGIGDDDTLSFYLVAFGGNGDAPYFRTKASVDYFEAEFECNSVSEVASAAEPHIKSLVKLLKGGAK